MSKLNSHSIFPYVPVLATWVILHGTCICLSTSCTGGGWEELDRVLQLLFYEWQRRRQSPSSTQISMQLAFTSQRSALDSCSPWLPGPFLQCCLSASWSPVCAAAEGYPIPHAGMHLPLLNFARFLFACFCCLWRSLWRAALLTFTLATLPAFKSPMKLLKCVPARRPGCCRKH